MLITFVHNLAEMSQVLAINHSDLTSNISILDTIVEFIIAIIITFITLLVVKPPSRGLVEVVVSKLVYCVVCFMAFFIISIAGINTLQITAELVIVFLFFDLTLSMALNIFFFQAGWGKAFFIYLTENLLYSLINQLIKII